MKTNNCIAVKVPDLERAKKFYGETLGLKLNSAETAENMLVYDTGELMLYIEKSENVQQPVPSFSASNIEEIKQKVKAEGCEIIWESNSGFWFKDPFGITYDVIKS